MHVLIFFTIYGQAPMHVAYNNLRVILFRNLSKQLAVSLRVLLKYSNRAVR